MSTDLQQPPLPPATAPDEATERLLRMLESVRLEKAEVEAKPEAVAEKCLCPQCGAPANWAASSWCPECGYYPKLGRAMTPVELEANSHAEPAIDLSWLAWLAAGACGLLILSISLRYLIPDPAERGNVGRVQFILGVIVVVAAQVRAYIIAARGTGDVPVSAIFFEPLQLWLPVLKQLPHSRRILYSGVWGMCLMLLALTVTGMDFDGMFSGLKPQKKKKNMMQSMVKAIASVEGKSAFSNMEEDEEEEEEQGLMKSGPRPAFGGSGGDIESAMKDFAGASGAEDYSGMTASEQQPGRKRKSKSGSREQSATGSEASGAGSEVDEKDDSAPQANPDTVSQQEPPAADHAAPADKKAEKTAQEPKVPESPAKDQPARDQQPGAAPPVDAAAAPTVPARKIPLSPSGLKREDQGRFVIFGYLTNPSGEIRSVLLAEVGAERSRFVSKMSLEELSDQARAELQQLLDQIRSPRPALKTPYQARWVRPLVLAQVAYVGRTPEGQLKEGYLISVDDTHLQRILGSKQASRP